MTGLALPLHQHFPLHRCGEVAAAAGGLEEDEDDEEEEDSRMIVCYAFACEPR
jgi:hypothetical protein